MAVRLRTRGVCEGCGSNMRPLDWAHLAGRNNKGVGEPWCSTPELTAGLCTSGYGHVGCHQKIDRALDQELLNRLRRNAAERLAQRYGLSPEIPDSYTAPLDSIRAVVRHLDQFYEWGGTSIVRRVLELAP